MHVNCELRLADGIVFDIIAGTSDIVASRFNFAWDRFVKMSAHVAHIYCDLLLYIHDKHWPVSGVARWVRIPYCVPHCAWHLYAEKYTLHLDAWEGVRERQSTGEPHSANAFRSALRTGVRFTT